jgi:hypothetical protein
MGRLGEKKGKPQENIVELKDIKSRYTVLGILYIGKEVIPNI